MDIHSVRIVYNNQNAQNVIMGIKILEINYWMILYQKYSILKVPSRILSDFFPLYNLI